MITLVLIGWTIACFKIPACISLDTQVIIIAIGVSSDLNILSQILKK